MLEHVGHMRRKMTFSACIAVLAVASMPLSAASLRVPITSRAGARAPVQASVTLTPVAVTGLEKRNAIKATAEVPGLFAAGNIAAGAWMIEVHANGYWHPPVVKMVADQLTEVPIALWPTATITGNVAVPPGGSVPRELTVRFQSAPSVKSEDRIPMAEINCPVADNRWSCEVPAAALDLRFHAAPFQTHFRWDTVVTRDEANDLGTIQLRTGSSLVGFVKLGANVKGTLEKTRVSLQPVTFAQPASEAPRAAMHVHAATVNARGFFRIEGAPPGDYAVAAQLEGAATPAVKVRLLPDREVELLDALVVAAPKPLSITLNPPLAPNGKPWRVALMAEAGPAGRTDLVTEEAAGADGTWRRNRVHNGRYRIHVKDTSGSTWLTHDLDTSVDRSDIRLEIPLLTVHGTVTLGESPVAAKLTFGGRGGSVSVPVQADENGRFRGVIRRDPALLQRLSVESELPSLSRVILKPKFDEMDDGSVRLDLVLPATHLVGEVTGPDGNYVQRALVRIKSDEHDWQSDVEVGPDGQFEAFGQAPGWITVQASAYLLESDPVRIELREDASARMQLKLRPIGTFNGRVMSSRGPVAGARVTMAPTDSEPLVVIPVTSNAKGEFTALLQPGTRQANVFVEAFGFASKMFQLVIPDHPIDIPLDQHGGTLIVTAPQFDGFEQTPKPFLLHAGARRVLYNVPGATFERDPKETTVRVRVPMLERGIYSVCLVTALEARQLNEQSLPKERCATGFVPPLGELSLTVR